MKHLTETTLDRSRTSAAELCGPEVRERDGLQEISRSIEAERLNHALEAKSVPEKKINQSYGITSSASLNIRTPGLVDILEFCEDLTSLEALSVDATFETDYMHSASYPTGL